MDDYTTIKEAFCAVGARLRVLQYPDPSWDRNPFTVSVERDRHGEYYVLSLGTVEVEFVVPYRRPRDRHLVLRALLEEPVETLDGGTVACLQYLCGHDERHWFVASVPPGVSSVEAAMEALKPSVVGRVQRRINLPTRDRNRRRNAAFVRQGEWFFLPAPHVAPREMEIIHDEPIARAGSTPHMVEEVFRRGGVTVHVCFQYPAGLTDAEYAKVIAADPRRKRLNWSLMTRDPEVFARGRVRHSDHKTIVLPYWHRVVMNQEFDAKLVGVRNPNVFLD